MDNTSSEEDSSSDYTTESSDDDGMETAHINGEKLQLPQGLCERQDIFRDIFCTETWNSLSDENRQHLQTLLPNFPENDDEEKTKTLQRLFDFDVFRFNSPLVKFHDDLKQGYFRPDIVRMRGIIRKTERREAKYRHKTFREQLKHEVIESQNRLLSQFRNLPPGIEPRQAKRKLNVDYVSHRTKKRYFQIVSSIRSKTDDPGCSSDENYPEGPPVPMSRKQKRHLNSIRNTLNSSKDKFFNSTMIAKLNGFSIDLEKYITPNHNPFYVNDELYRNMIDQHKQRKLECPDDPELNTKGIVLSDIVHRTQLPYNKNLPVIVKHQVENKVVNRKRVKREHVNHRRSPENVYLSKVKVLYEQSSNSDSDSDSTIDAVTVSANKPRTKARRTPTLKSKVEVKKEIPSPEPIKPTNIMSISASTKPTVMKTINNISQYGKITPACVEDLDGIDVMSIPIDLDDSEIDILELSNKPELMQDTHANFFSLVRDIICSTNEHRMNMYTLQERLKTWQENPISPLNDWYSFTDNWIGILPSAITFLCGNASEQPDDFVPYMEYKSSLDVYQWIGAGRDSDILLSSICNFWLEHRSENKSVSPAKDSELDLDVYTDRSNTPPPPRCPTNWTVRKASPEEIKDFREQERRRYDNPHKAFTYRCNNYESVVGPIKGIYNPAVGNTKARGHTMLSADRPNFVTILSLVRDAAARLPNGEGTRAEICELLKSSQYISSTATDNLLQSVVSGALDRMHTQWDPCVKYDPKKKIWIYLHRNRTEEDFERIHQHYQGINKSKKSSTKKSPVKPKVKQAAEKAPKAEQPQAMVVETVQESCDPPPPPLSLQEPPAKVAPKQQTIAPPSQQSTAVPGLITVATPSKSTSLLLCNNLPKSQMHETGQAKVVLSDEPPPLAVTSSSSGIQQQKGDKEINEAIHAIIQNRVSSPTVKSGKSLVKMLSPSQGKSLIIPSTNPQLIKQIQEQRGTTTKQMSQVVTQQLLQTIAAQQKQMLVQKHNVESAESRQEKLKVPASVQQQILQSIPAQQLQNIKNVTLLRSTSSSNMNLTPIASVSSQSVIDQSNIVTVAVTKTEDSVGQPGVQIKTHGTLTQAQQHQILQTIKQKILPNSGMLANNQQQIILKQKSGVLQVQKSGAGAAAQVLSQHKVSLDNTSKSIPSHGPVVAKVLTNAAGQVISLESLLNHQKQHGALAQGTTLRVSGKSGQQNLIHLTGTTKPNALAQFAVGSQHSLLTLTNQPKLVVASHTSTVTSSSATATKPASRTIGKCGQTVPKTNSKINAKLVQSLEAQKKSAGAGKNAPFPKPLTLNVAGAANALRMVNTANLNLSHLGGKPILVASGKGGALQNLQGQNVILQTQGNSSAPSLVLQNAAKGAANSPSNSINIINQPNIVFSQQLKVQQPQQMMFAQSKGGQGAAGQHQALSQGHIVLGGHPVRLHTSNATNAQRVVLASQGQGGQIVAQQILLPAGFQGTAINIKALQGVKVIPIAQAAAAQAKGIQGRQVLARVMNPGLVKTTTPTTSITEKITEVTLQSRGGE